MTKLNVIIFSKDRAAQLDGLLRSIRDKVTRWDTDMQWSVIYACSSTKFRAGYDIAKQDNNSASIRYICENDEKRNFKAIVSETMRSQHDSNGAEWSMFLVDDILFKSGWAWDDAKPLKRLRNDDEVLAASLRLCHRYDWSYGDAAVVKSPFRARFGRWNWHKVSGDWGYPMSVDGHIFRYSDISPIVDRIEFSQPNNFEEALSKNAIKARPFMTCYKEAVVVNLPINRVQNEVSNKAGDEYGISAEELNELFLNGKRVQLDAVYALKDNRGCHHEMPLLLS